MVARRGTGGDEAVAEHVAPPRVALGVPRRGRLAPVVLEASGRHGWVSSSCFGGGFFVPTGAYWGGTCGSLD